MQFTLQRLFVVTALTAVAIWLAVGVVRCNREVELSHHLAWRVVEIGQLDMSFKQYKVLFGEYPPNFSSGNAVRRHLRSLFPRNLDAPPAGLDPAEALVFWLQGFADNPIHPLTGRRRMAIMQFDATRLRDADADGFPEYYPYGCKTPYVYFYCATYANESFTCSPITGVARPYRSDVTRSGFVNEDTFQIIWSGLDDHFGHGGSFPSGRGYAKEDLDNVTNFSGGTLESKRSP